MGQITLPVAAALVDVLQGSDGAAAPFDQGRALTLVWAVLDLYITHATNGIKFTQLDRQRFKRIRYEGSAQTIPEEVSAA